MKTLFFDCGMGAAGDMLTGALLELLPEPGSFLEELNSLGIPHVHFSAARIPKCGILGTHVTVTVEGVEEDENCHHAPIGMPKIREIVGNLPISDTVKSHILAVYGLIARGESRAHGLPVEQIHFHEVGTMDAVADITAVCLLMDRLAPDQVLATPVHVGSGTVRCAHGILPVPAPATAHILEGVPIYGGSIRGELCTPTGAALLKHYVNRFGDMPVLTPEQIGYGMGRKDFPRANCVRAILGTTQAPSETVLELSCNVDDMTPEQMGFALETALEAGALDAFTVPIGMKKSRPGILFTLLCRPEDEDAMTRLLFRHTTTLGIRRNVLTRSTLDRRITTVDSCFGPVRRKDSTGWGVTRQKYEYGDLSRLAREHHCSIPEILKKLP